MNSSGFAGATDWRLANSSETNLLFSAIETVGDARQFDPTYISSVLGLESVVGRYYDLWEISPLSGSTRGADWEYFSSEIDSSTSFERLVLPGARYEDHYASEFVGAFVVSSATAVPVPEPSTFLLLGGGLAGLAFVTRRKRKV